MGEQSVAAAQVATSTKSMRKQSDQVSKGMSEQARAAKEMTIAIKSISKDVALIGRANREHLESASNVLNGIKEVQQVATKNAANAKLADDGPSGLGERAEQLAELMNNMEAGTVQRQSRTGRRKSKKAGSIEGV